MKFVVGEYKHTILTDKNPIVAAWHLIGVFDEQYDAV
jgi:hypothetical protein